MKKSVRLHYDFFSYSHSRPASSSWLQSLLFLLCLWTSLLLERAVWYVQARYCADSNVCDERQQQNHRQSHEYTCCNFQKKKKYQRTSTRLIYLNHYWFHHQNYQQQLGDWPGVKNWYFSNKARLSVDESLSFARRTWLEKSRFSSWWTESANSWLRSMVGSKRSEADGSTSRILVVEMMTV